MPTEPSPAPAPADAARGLIRASDRASLGTLMAGDGAPYASLVMVACDLDGSPLLLLSQLAQHTKNLLADDRVSLLYDGTAGLDNPLTGARVSVQGRAAVTADPRHRARYLARHPDSAQFADFGDFAFYRVAVSRAHLVAGFGRIHWVDAADLLPAHDDRALAEAEAGIVEHMNEDHADAVQLYASRLLGAGGDGWAMTGIDTEGCDLRRGGEVLRLPFLQTIRNAGEARASLVALVKQARAAG